MTLELRFVETTELVRDCEGVCVEGLEVRGEDVATDDEAGVGSDADENRTVDEALEELFVADAEDDRVEGVEET